MSETVIREVTKGIWTFSRPFARFGIFPVGGRSTAIQLKNGGVWVLASTPLDKETKSTLDGLGPVEYIVSPDAVHYLFLREFKAAYPTAKLLAPAEVTENSATKDLKFDGIWGKDAPDTKYGFEDEIEHCYFAGFKNKDVAFFHKESKSLIEADLLMNLPPTEQYSKSKSWATFLGMRGFHPHAWGYAKFIKGLGTDPACDARTVMGWDFQRIIPCHGDVIETGAKEAWRAVYSSFLESK
ncbi:hypothetical protein BKA70DRAFT_1102529 [Coprinopsis sp. MPI-PUGE-AT-0042]|nr:hypothetical protein BKA70DRAFT_1102529 [Coprinopsis sp. MPI-PUGE-AT-0042]